MTPCVMISGDFTLLGGMDHANYELAWHLAERVGTRVHLVAYRVSEPLSGHPNVTWHRVKRAFGSYLLSAPRLARAGRRVIQSIPGARAIVNGANCAWADVNWAQYVHAAAAHVPSANWRSALRGTLTGPGHRRAERRAFRIAKLILANSNRTHDDLVERCGVNPDVVRTVYYGNDCARFQPVSTQRARERRAALGWPEERPIIAFVGALGDRRKGFDVLFDAWKKLNADPAWDGILVVIGAGRELDGWRDRASASGMAQSIQFLGFRNDVPELLPVCDALVSPTRYEAYGLGVHEALCCGLPALVSASAGIAERYPAALSDLLIAEPLDASALADQLRRWRQRREHYRSLVTPLGDMLRRRSWEQMSAEIVELMELNCPASSANARQDFAPSPLPQNR
jgi:glycosyltransferase involved in cell wall biosynthesis